VKIFAGSPAEEAPQRLVPPPLFQILTPCVFYRIVHDPLLVSPLILFMADLKEGVDFETI